MLICSLINVSGTNCANPLQIPITVESCLISQSAQIYRLQNLMDRCLKGRFWKLQNLLLLSKACGFSKNEFRPRASTLPGSLWEMQIPRPHHRPADLGTEGGAESSVFSKFSRRFWHTGVKDHCCRWILHLWHRTLGHPVYLHQEAGGDPVPFSEEDSVLFLSFSFKPRTAKARYMCFLSPLPCLKHSHHGEFSPTDLQKPRGQLAGKILSCQGPHGYSGAGRGLWIPLSWSGAWMSEDNHCGLVTRVTTHRLILDPQHKASTPLGSCQTLWTWTLYCPDFIGNESQFWLHIRIT